MGKCASLIIYDTIAVAAVAAIITTTFTTISCITNDDNKKNNDNKDNKNDNQDYIIITTLMSKIVEHTDLDEHLKKVAENLIIEHLFYTTSCPTNNNRTPEIFSTALIVKRLRLLGKPEDY